MAMPGAFTMPQGDLAAAAASMTPGPSPPTSQQLAQMPTTGQPSGLTPNAKRPLNPSTFAVAQTGSRMMSQEDLSAAVNNLIALQSRDEKVLSNVWEAVGWNAGLANALVTRVNNMEAAAKLDGRSTCASCRTRRPSGAVGS